MSFSICLSKYLSLSFNIFCLSPCPVVYLSIYVSICPFVNLQCLLACPFYIKCSPFYMSFVCLSNYLYFSFNVLLIVVLIPFITLCLSFYQCPSSCPSVLSVEIMQGQGRKNFLTVSPLIQ